MKISATVQFHNEKEFLEGWFASASRYADEIICGSHCATDGSLEYVQSLQKNYHIPIKIVEFPADTLHRYGFCYMKNVLAEHATGEWIVSLDADEEMDMTKQSLMPYSRGNNVSISTATMHLQPDQKQPEWNLNDREPIRTSAPWIHQRHWRIFRNGLGVKWRGLIHEELRMPDGRHVGFSCRQSPIRMFHFGAFADQSKRSHKDGLYAELLLRAVENPEMREGTNKWWWTTYYIQNRAKLEVDRESYRKDNPHFQESYIPLSSS